MLGSKLKTHFVIIFNTVDVATLLGRKKCQPCCEKKMIGGLLVYNTVSHVIKLCVLMYTVQLLNTGLSEKRKKINSRPNTGTFEFWIVFFDTGYIFVSSEFVFHEILSYTGDSSLPVAGSYIHPDKFLGSDFYSTPCIEVVRFRLKKVWCRILYDPDFFQVRLSPDLRDTVVLQTCFFRERMSKMFIFFLFCASLSL